jgi:Domain of unknown function (DUF4384)
MRFRLSTACKLAVAISVLIAPCALIGRVEAQKQGAPLWYSVVTVSRVKKPDRKPARPAPKTQKAAPLTLQWHIVKRVDDTNQEETDSTKEFQTGDKLKLGITANQNGYLYIINQPQGKDGVMLFPDLRINKGQNYVLKDKEYSVPSYCQNFEDPKDCWFQMTPPAGTETLIVIFSRDKITTLPNQIAKPYATVKRDVVEQLLASSQQKVEQMTGELKVPGQKAVRYATRVQNTNLKDNEELIATIELTHAE